MTEKQLLIVIGGFIVMIIIFLAIIGYLDYEVNRLRRDNKLLSRVLEDYFRLEDGSKRTAQAILREADYTSQLPPEWWS